MPTDYRVIKIRSNEVKNVKIRCPFCGKDNLKTRCEHLEKIDEPHYRNFNTGNLVGNYIYLFKRFS